MIHDAIISKHKNIKPDCTVTETSCFEGMRDELCLYKSFTTKKSMSGWAGLSLPLAK